MQPPKSLYVIAFILNGEPCEAAFAPHKTLLEVLSQENWLTGTEPSYELGECGTCTNCPFDGRPRSPTSSLGWRARGAPSRPSKEWRERPCTRCKLIADLGAAQCGYCHCRTSSPPRRCSRRTPNPRVTRSGRRWPATCTTRATSRSMRRWSWRGQQRLDPARSVLANGRERAASRYRRGAAQGRRRGQGPSRARRRLADNIGSAPDALRQAAAQSASPCPHPECRHLPRQLEGVKAVLAGKDSDFSRLGFCPVSQDEHALCPRHGTATIGDPVAAMAATTRRRSPPPQWT